MYTTIQRVFKMYIKLYALHGFIFYLISRKYLGIPNANADITQHSSLGMCQHNQKLGFSRRTNNLTTDITLRRLFLRNPTRQIQTFPYFNDWLHSILAERDFRAQQVNNLVLSHLVMGKLRKKSCSNGDVVVKDEFGSLPWWIFANTILADGFTISTDNVPHLYAYFHYFLKNVLVTMLVRTLHNELF